MNDNEEYKKWMIIHFKKSEIIHEIITSYNFNQNNVVKRMN